MCIIFPSSSPPLTYAASLLLLANYVYGIYVGLMIAVKPDELPILGIFQILVVIGLSKTLVFALGVFGFKVTTFYISLIGYSYF